MRTFSHSVDKTFYSPEASASTSVEIDSGLNKMAEATHEKLNFGGDTNDSPWMNPWLQKKVMTKLAGNGGKVMPELRA